jgi:hypothetical protein
MGNLPHNVGVRNSKCGGKKLKDFGKCFYSYKCCVALCCGFKKKLYKYNLCVSTIYNKSKESSGCISIGWGGEFSPPRLGLSLIYAACCFL